MLSNIYSWLNGEKGPEKNIFLIWLEKLNFSQNNTILCYYHMYFKMNFFRMKVVINLEIFIKIDLDLFFRDLLASNVDFHRTSICLFYSSRRNLRQMVFNIWCQNVSVYYKLYTLISYKVTPVHLVEYFLSYDQIHFEMFKFFF